MTQVNTITKSHKGTDLTYAEMKQIEAYKKIELSHREIGRLLERSPQTINDNVKKGTVLQVNKQIQNGKAYFYEKEVYFADVNFRIYEENRENCGRRPNLNGLMAQSLSNGQTKRCLKRNGHQMSSLI